MTRRKAALDDADLLKLLYYLRLSRAFEERLSVLTRQGKVVGGIFSGVGQGYSPPFEKAFAIPEVSTRAQAYGFPGVNVYGNDRLRVHGVMQEAIGRARRGLGPTLLECMTFRWHGHSEHDRASHRTEDELLENPLQMFV